jgi:NTE family protein
MEAKRKTVGLALGAGGWRGLAHIGVIKEFNKEGIPIDYIAGSSTGALIGGLYSYFLDTEKIENILKSLNYLSLFKILLEPGRRLGLIKGGKYLSFLEHYIDDTHIQDLKIKYAAVATDLFEGKSVVIRRGKLSSAIRASSSIPLVFNPVKRKGKYLIDGAATAPVPVKVVRKMGADIVVAVNLYNNIFPFKLEYLKKPRLTSFAISRISYQMVLYSLAKEDVKAADIVINPKIWEGYFDIFNKFINNKTTIEDGQRAARAMMPAIKRLL